MAFGLVAKNQIFGAISAIPGPKGGTPSQTWLPVLRTKKAGRKRCEGRILTQVASLKHRRWGGERVVLQRRGRRSPAGVVAARPPSCPAPSQLKPPAAYRPTPSPIDPPAARRRLYSTRPARSPAPPRFGPPHHLAPSPLDLPATRRPSRRRGSSTAAAA